MTGTHIETDTHIEPAPTAIPETALEDLRRRLHMRQAAGRSSR